MRCDIRKIIPSDPADYSASTPLNSATEYEDIKFGETLYIIDPPIYVVTPDRKLTDKYQKFKLTKSTA